jgi:hypothetical protein
MLVQMSDAREEKFPGIQRSIVTITIVMIHEENTVINSLINKRDVLGTDSIMGEIYIRHAQRNRAYQGDLGNGSLGKLDFLRKQGWRVFQVVDDREYHEIMDKRYRRRKSSDKQNKGEVV